jgi:hypothetical protein
MNSWSPSALHADAITPRQDGLLDTFLRQEPRPPAYYGGSDGELRSVLCAINVVPGSGPCAACRQLSNDSTYQLTRRNRKAEDCIRSLLNSNLPYTFPKHPLPYMGLPVLLARLEAAHKALHSLSDECTAQKRVSCSP